MRGGGARPGAYPRRVGQRWRHRGFWRISCGYSKRVGRAAAAAGYTTLFTSLPTQCTGMIDGCRLIGRYAIRRDTSADEAALAATGHWRPWARQRAAWRMRGAAKSIAGERYESMRRALLARR